MIELSALTKRFGTTEVLRGVSLRVEPGCVTGIIGPNGTGKTTLLKTILGLTRPDGGEIRVFGQVVGPDERYRRDIGYMPQIARFPGNLTAAELFDMLRRLRGVEPGPSESLDEELIDRFGLRSDVDRPLRVLSGGTRQKVNACMAFLFRPRVLIFDEPTAGLDPVSSSVLKDKILAARGAGATVIVTSHVMSEMEELCDNVAFLLDGVVRFHGSVRELTTLTRQNNLERAIAALMIRAVA